MEIARNGEQFLIRTPHDKLGLGATYKDGFLQVPGVMGALTLTYVKSTDALIAPGLSGQSEYKRVDHFATPNAQATMSLPGGTISANTADTFTAADLGTDIYPGAQSGKGSVRMTMPTGSWVTAVFVTPDSKDQVVSFYKSKFGSEVSVFDSGDSAVISVQKSKQESIMVTVTANKSEYNGKTQIAIVHTISNKAQ
jgi:hypothetical protein